MINSSDRSALEYLLKSLLLLENEKEAENFLNDICTVPEIKAITQRLQVAKMLYNNCVYTDIVEQTGASTATISRVNRTLNDERHINGMGYHTILERMGEQPPEKNTRKGKSK